MSKNKGATYDRTTRGLPRALGWTACLGLVTAVSISLGGTAWADDTTDAQFVQNVRTAGVSGPDAQLISAGRFICDRLRSGEAAPVVINGPDPGIAEQLQEEFVAASKAAYCPEQIPETTGEQIDGQGDTFRPDYGQPGDNSWVLEQSAIANGQSLDAITSMGD